MIELNEARLNLAKGHEALLGQEDWLIPKNELATVVNAAHSHTDRPLHYFRMDLIKRAINLPRCFDEFRIHEH